MMRVLLVVLLILFLSCVSCLISNRVIRRQSISQLMMASDPRSNKLKGLGGKVIVTGTTNTTNTTTPTTTNNNTNMMTNTNNNIRNRNE